MSQYTLISELVHLQFDIDSHLSKFDYEYVENLLKGICLDHTHEGDTNPSFPLVNRWTDNLSNFLIFYSTLTNYEKFMFNRSLSERLS